MRLVAMCYGLGDLAGQRPIDGQQLLHDAVLCKSNQGIRALKRTLGAWTILKSFSSTTTTKLLSNTTPNHALVIEAPWEGSGAN